jgi:general stress protein YciG
MESHAADQARRNTEVPLRAYSRFYIPYRNQELEMNKQTPQNTPDTSNRGFASMSEERQREIASKGGQASGGNFKNDPERAAEAGHKGGQVSGGNFKNDPERAAEAGHKGGQASGGNFKNDPERASEAGKRSTQR